MCAWGTDTPLVVCVPATLSHTGKDKFTIKGIDACIAPIVRRLNAAGVITDNCCCGHGKADGWISLADGREIIIKQKDSVV